MISEPKPVKRKVEVKTDAGSFLFAYHVDTHTIEVHKRGQVFVIPVLDLIEFGRTSQRVTFRVVPNVPVVDPADDVVIQKFE